jgi:nitrite reductase/ring-hydroxylating ferredoxin subunit
MRLCASAELEEGGPGVRFEFEIDGRNLPAFAVRHGGVARAYLNRCAHVAMELDWLPGAFFDAEQTLLMCSTHGALYAPGSGRCVGGPCVGHGGLEPLVLIEREGAVYCDRAVKVEPV